MNRRGLTAIILLVIVLSGIGLVLWQSERSKQQVIIVTAAYVPAGYYAPILLADELGYFREEGLTLKLVRYNDNSLMINQFINGNLDLTAQSALTMFPIAEEHPRSFVFIYGQYAKSYFFVAPKSSEIEAISDIRGKSVGTWQSPTAVAYIRLLTEKQGIRAEEYELSRFGATDVPSALINGISDVIFTFDFPAESLVQSGDYQYVEPDALDGLLDEGRPLFNGGAMVSQELLRSDPTKVRAIERALAKSIDYIQGHPENARRALAKILNVQIEIPNSVQLDAYALPNDQMRRSATATYDLMVRSGLARGGSNIDDLFLEK